MDSKKNKRNFRKNTNYQKDIEQRSNINNARQRGDVRQHNNRVTQPKSPISYITNHLKLEIDYSKVIQAYQINYKRALSASDTQKDLFIPKDKQKSIVKSLFEKFNFKYYVYDGDKNVYTSELLKPHQLVQNNFKPEDFTDTLCITFTHTGSINLSSMKNYDAFEARQALPILNMALKQNLSQSRLVLKDSFFNLDDERLSLDDNYECMFGHYQAIKCGKKAWYLNIDSEAAKFYKPMNLLEKLNQLENNKKIFECEIKGLMMTTSHDPGNKKKYKILGVSKQSADSYEFDNKIDGQESTVRITVAKHFENKYKKLSYPNLPCILAGNPQQPLAFPIEVCSLAEFQRFNGKLPKNLQSKFTKEAIVKPSVRFEKIKLMASKCEYDEDYLKNFGFKDPNFFRKDFIKISGNIMSPRSIQFNEKNKENVEDGSWRINVKKETLHEPVVLNNYMILWLRYNKKKFGTMEPVILEVFKQTLKNLGMHGSNPPIIKNLWGMSASNVKEMLEKEKVHPQFCLCLIDDDDRDEISLHDDLKITIEKELGIVTQCFCFSKIEKQFSPDPNDKKKLNEYFKNLCMKINTKLGGINSLVQSKASTKSIGIDDSLEKVMLMGADVAHDLHKKSAAAVVCSLDKHFSKYFSKLSQQQNKDFKKDSQEIIVDMKEMYASLLNTFMDANDKEPPTRIIYIRDGVDNGQFKKIVDSECAAIREVFDELKLEVPKITLIICQKRNQRRIFGVYDDQGKIIDNIPPGFVIDDYITSKDNLDFYMCSHKAIMGTAKVPHYVIALDEIGIKRNELQEFLFNLCHAYGPSTKTISLPVPLYCSHLAAFRAQIYGKTEQLYELSNIIEVDDKLEGSMYYI